MPFSSCLYIPLYIYGICALDSFTKMQYNIQKPKNRKSADLLVTNQLHRSNMEKSEEFKKVVDSIKQLEQQLLSIDEGMKKNETCGEETEMKIEDHFAMCMNTLAARKERLLRELGKHIENHSMHSHFSFISFPSCSLSSIPQCNFVL